MSSSAFINSSLVQGSGIGPISFSIFISDLKTLSNINKTDKYADDLTLLSPSFTDVDVSIEFQNICKWADKNGMVINESKTKEIIFYNHAKPPSNLVCLPNIERVKQVKLLGIEYGEKLTFVYHINNLLNVVNQRLYLVNSLRKSGLSTEALNVVFNALIVSKLTYCVPSWHTHVSVTDAHRIDKFLEKAFKWQCCQNLLKWDTIVENIDNKLFKQIVVNPCHCLTQLLPLKKVTGYNLRQKSQYVLPSISKDIFKHSFINHMLFLDCY